MAASVLIVDDDADVVRELRTVMAAHDIHVESASTPEGAATLLDQQRFCGLVLDLVLENGSGFDVLHHLSKRNLKVPTVVVTSKLPSYVREMLSAEDVKLVFPKPVEPRLLTAVVLGLCGIATP
ncbi:MAG TPA: response regulator [Thermoanaerobaculia bacterium]|nr:response regulator [Thermoanaerobaculia bacterium]